MALTLTVAEALVAAADVLGEEAPTTRNPDARLRHLLDAVPRLREMGYEPMGHETTFVATPEGGFWVTLDSPEALGELALSCQLQEVA